VATIVERKGKWRVQIRRDGHGMSKNFYLKAAAEDWAHEAENAVDNQLINLPKLRNDFFRFPFPCHRDPPSRPKPYLRADHFKGGGPGGMSWAAFTELTQAQRPALG
jgi:hypothetical protein